jgi:predicted GNAT family N-acyltransferase
MSKLLITTALEYLRENPLRFCHKYYRLEELLTAIQEKTTKDAPIAWKGLVVVHAQRDKTVDLWKKYGFEIDEGMGEWDEEGMMHVGMWLRVDIGRK